MRLIDADAYLEKIKADPLYSLIERYGVGGTIEAMPTIDAEPVRHGKWIWDDEGYHCSECWYHAQGNTQECIDGTFRFCPVCGARMNEVNDDSK